MWESHYESAINDYQAGLIKMLTDTAKPIPEMLQYIQFRLALAYLLDGQPFMSSAASIVLHTQQPASKLMTQLYNVIPRRPSTDTYKVCAAAHDVFQKYIDIATNDSESGSYNLGLYTYIPTAIIVGMNHDNNIPATTSDIYVRLPDPNKAGCDIAQPILDKLRAQSFTTTKPLTAQLERLGLPTIYSLTLDINHEGQSESLIWLNINVPPLFFAQNSDGRTYHVSYAPFQGGFHVFDGMVRALPSNNGYVLLAIVTGNGNDSGVCPVFVTGYDQAVGNTSSFGTFSLFRLKHGELTEILSSPLCDPVNDLSMFELPYFNGGNFIESTNRSLPDTIPVYMPIKNTFPYDSNNLVQANYTWDDNTQTYLPPATLPVLADRPTPIYAWNYINQFDNALDRTDYTSALHVADQAILNPCTQYCDKAYTVNYHFLRATALEYLGRDAEAIAEYLFVAENAASPEQSALAMMHLAPIDF